MADKTFDDEDDDDDLDGSPEADESRAPSGSDGEGPTLDDEEPKRGRGKLIAILAVAVTLFIAVAGAGAYVFVFSGHDEESAATAQSTESAETADAGDATSMVITRNDGTPVGEPAPQAADKDGGLTPPAPNQPAPNQNVSEQSASTQSAPQSQAAAPQATAPAPAAALPAQQQATAMPPARPQAPPTQSQAKGATGKGATTPDTQGLVTPAVTVAAYRNIPVLPAAKPLAAPDPAYNETVDGALIPRARGSQGVWKVNGRPFEGAADKPKVTIILTGLGLSRAASLAAISQTPAGVTLAFDPYTRNLDEWVGLGRSSGHEALMQLPMEPGDFPVSDPGPLALLTDLDAAQNIQRLKQVLGAAVGYTGLIQVMGSKFAASEAALRPTLDEMKKRGVLFVSVPANGDDRGFALAREVGVPSTRVDLKLDTELTAAAIDGRIAELERMAQENGHAVGIAEPHPVTLARLSVWGQSLSLKEIQLAPASAIVQVAPPPGAAKGAAKH